MLGLGGFLFAAAPLRAQSTHALIVTGVSGEPRFAQQFARDAGLMRDALTRRFGASVTILAENTTPRSDKPSIIAALQKLASGSRAGDQVLIVLLGHGSGQGDDARFNITGPDLTAREIGAMLGQFKGRELAVVVATSASGAFIKPLRGDGRVIITATRSAAENEEVVFARYFAKALSEDVADIDKDGAVALTEAFQYAKLEVERFYKQQNRLSTEHALLDGAAAGAFVLRAPSANADDPQLRSWYGERAALERQITQLRARKTSLRIDIYEAELEKLLLQMARIDQRIRAAGQK